MIDELHREFAVYAIRTEPDVAVSTGTDEAVESDAADGSSLIGIVVYGGHREGICLAGTSNSPA